MEFGPLRKVGSEETTYLIADDNGKVVAVKQTYARSTNNHGSVSYSKLTHTDSEEDDEEIETLGSELFRKNTFAIFTSDGTENLMLRHHDNHFIITAKDGNTEFLQLESVRDFFFHATPRIIVILAIMRESIRLTAIDRVTNKKIMIELSIALMHCSLSSINALNSERFTCMATGYERSGKMSLCTVNFTIELALERITYAESEVNMIESGLLFEPPPLIEEYEPGDPPTRTLADQSRDPSQMDSHMDLPDNEDKWEQYSPWLWTNPINSPANSWIQITHSNNRQIVWFRSMATEATVWHLPPVSANQPFPDDLRALLRTHREVMRTYAAKPEWQTREGSAELALQIEDLIADINGYTGYSPKTNAAFKDKLDLQDISKELIDRLGWPDVNALTLCKMDHKVISRFLHTAHECTTMPLPAVFVACRTLWPAIIYSDSSVISEDARAFVICYDEPPEKKDYYYRYRFGNLSILSDDDQLNRNNVDAIFEEFDAEPTEFTCLVVPRLQTDPTQDQQDNFDESFELFREATQRLTDQGTTFWTLRVFGTTFSFFELNLWQIEEYTDNTIFCDRDGTIAFVTKDQKFYDFRPPPDNYNDLWKLQRFFHHEHGCIPELPYFRFRPVEIENYKNTEHQMIWRCLHGDHDKDEATDLLHLFAKSIAKYDIDRSNAILNGTANSTKSFQAITGTEHWFFRTST
jgi:hypothetical protein